VGAGVIQVAESLRRNEMGDYIEKGLLAANIATNMKVAKEIEKSNDREELKRLAVNYLEDLEEAINSREPDVLSRLRHMVDVYNDYAAMGVSKEATSDYEVRKKIGELEQKAESILYSHITNPLRRRAFKGEIEKFKSNYHDTLAKAKKSTASLGQKPIFRGISEYSPWDHLKRTSIFRFVKNGKIQRWVVVVWVLLIIGIIGALMDPYAYQAETGNHPATILLAPLGIDLFNLLLVYPFFLTSKRLNVEEPYAKREKEVNKIVAKANFYKQVDISDEKDVANAVIMFVRD
jgi:hypothetical protein